VLRMSARAVVGQCRPDAAPFEQERGNAGQHKNPGEEDNGAGARAQRPGHMMDAGEGRSGVGGQIRQDVVLPTTW